MLHHQKSNFFTAIMFIAMGFILGCLITDAIRLKEEVDARQSAVDFGYLVLSYLERPDHCPYCGYDFIYLYNLPEEELQRIIMHNMGRIPYEEN